MNPVNITDAPSIDATDILGTSSLLPPELSETTIVADSPLTAVREDDDPLTQAIASSRELEEISIDIPSVVPTVGLAQSTGVGGEGIVPAVVPTLEDNRSVSLSTQSKDPSRTLMLVGGGWQYPLTKDPYGVSIYLDFLERAGGVEDAKIGIFTTASFTPRKNGKLYIQDFQDLYDLYLKKEFPNQSIEVEWIPLTINNQERKKNSEAFADKIKEYTGFIFGGGDQSFITESFFNENPKDGTRTKTPIYRALKNRFNHGAVVAGTSAGTSVQVDPAMITEGESFESLVNDPISKIGSPPSRPDLYYNPLGGLGFFDYGLLDTHFSERGRQGRIIRLAAEVKEDMAYGVDENTALVVSDIGTSDVKMEVLGENGVFISDLSDAKVSDKKYWSISGVNTTYLTEGDTFDPLTKTAKFPEKSRFRGKKDTEITVGNIFSRKEDGAWTSPRRFTETAIDLFQSKAAIAIGRSRDADPVRYEVRMEKTRNSQGFSGFDLQDVERFSFTNLNVDIGPIL